MYPVFFSLLRRSDSSRDAETCLVNFFAKTSGRIHFGKTFSLRDDAIPKLHVRQNSLYKNVILVPYNKITVVYL